MRPKRNLSDPYRIMARHYDSAYAQMKDLIDAPFYFELAKKSRGPVLEIGCGTGRVLLPIARAGIEIHGLDASPHMLKILSERLTTESAAVRKKVHLHKGDMRRFRLRQKFPLVIMPFRPLQHMHTLADQLAALRTASLHLAPRGTFAFDVYFPNFEKILSGIGQETQEIEWPVPGRAGRMIRRFYRKEFVDKIHQTIGLSFLFRTYEGEKLIHEEPERFAMSFYTYPHLRALFLLAGLEPVAEYGSFKRTPLDNSSPEMVFLLRKSK
jgi:SAM-dependent methyltransferase